jgi:WD40 repeat protein
VVGLNNARPDLTAQLRQTPRESTEGGDAFVTPAEPEEEASLGLSVLNQIKLGGNRRPIACSWSKYGETVAIASSDNLISIWNIPGRTLETVAVGDEDIIIRNVRFISDVIVAVALSQSSRILLVDVDEGVLYEPDALESVFESSKNASLDFSAPKGSSKLLLARPCHDQLRRWLVGL